MDLSELERQNKDFHNRHPWESVRARIIDFFLKNHFSFRHIADIGSGDAYVLQSLQKKEYAEIYTAIDTAYTEEHINRIKERNTEDIRFYKNISAAKDIPADLILLLDVLEHCSGDTDILREITNNELSGKEALFVITVPAGKWLFSQHDKLLGHYRRYSRKQLLRLCEDSNLKVIRSGYFFFSLVPVRIMIKLLEKAGLRKTTRSIDHWKKGKLPTNFISLILWLDFRICHALSSAGINIPGLSCYCICQKQQ